MKKVKITIEVEKDSELADRYNMEEVYKQVIQVPLPDDVVALITQISNKVNEAAMRGNIV